MSRSKKDEKIVKEEKEISPKVDLSEIKEELTFYIDKEIKKGFDDEVKKVYGKLLREKGRKILVRNIIILVLLAVIGYLTYLLYDNHYFDKFFNKSSNQTNEVVKTDTPKTEEDNGPSLEDLKKEFGYLLNNVNIDEESVYISDYYKGNLNNELKNYLALNNMDITNLPVDDECNVIESDLFKQYYSKLFDGEFSKNSFDYNGDRIRFINKLDSFITTDVLEKKKTNIVREIVDIQVSESYISITTVEGVVKDNKLYNIVSKDEIKNYKKDSLVNYQDKLNKVTYMFKENLLESINK